MNANLPKCQAPRSPTTASHKAHVTTVPRWEAGNPPSRHTYSRWRYDPPDPRHSQTSAVSVMPTSFGEPQYRHQGHKKVSTRDQAENASRCFSSPPRPIYPIPHLGHQRSAQETTIRTVTPLLSVALPLSLHLPLLGPLRRGWRSPPSVPSLRPRAAAAGSFSPAGAMPLGPGSCHLSPAAFTYQGPTHRPQPLEQVRKTRWAPDT